MSEEVQERVEDYLGLEQYIEQLRLQRSARLPDNLAPQQTHIYAMALLFHTATPRIADPQPSFKTQLGQRLREQLRAEEPSSGPAPTNLSPPPEGQAQFRPIFRQNQAAQPTHILPSLPESTREKKDTRRGLAKKSDTFSRRKLAAMAAGLLVTTGIGASAGAIIEHDLGASAPPSSGQTPRLTGDNWQWQPVASVEQLGQDALPFTTQTISGYLIRPAGNSTEPIVALSAACTHLGCTLAWKTHERVFECPCHNTLFGETGSPSPQNHQPYPPLPHLDTKTEGGQIYVKVPPATITQKGRE